MKFDSDIIFKIFSFFIIYIIGNTFGLFNFDTKSNGLVPNSYNLIDNSTIGYLNNTKNLYLISEKNDNFDITNTTKLTNSTEYETTENKKNQTINDANPIKCPPKEKIKFKIFKNIPWQKCNVFSCDEFSTETCAGLFKKDANKKIEFNGDFTNKKKLKNCVKKTAIKKSCKKIGNLICKNESDGLAKVDDVCGNLKGKENFEDCFLKNKS